VLFGVDGPEQSANRSLFFNVKNATRSVILAGNLEVTGGAFLSGTNTRDITPTHTDTIDFTLTGQALTGSVRSQMSITSDASGLKLSGDSSTPGNNKVYGTNGSGTKGWHNGAIGGTPSAYIATPTVQQLRDILIDFGLMQPAP
jgi:hypothetical protein